MKFFKDYDIEVIKLKEGKHEFSFPVTDEFFKHFEENEIVSKGNLTALVTLSKEANLIDAIFDIKGSVELTCDRSLELFDHPLETTQRVRYKYGPEEAEINEEIFMITRDTPKINVAQLIYEFIILAIPAKKVHPDHVYEMDEDDFEAEGELVYSSGDVEDEPSEQDEESSESEENTDPRWEALKNLKKKD
ncbi:DUF177 domain-containing protein [Litoribacter alkaliphilus]|uniref:DUF177 domain-containing protein n=1 Tax=Litoribacter ruber TaxID=702568 RepID=A0AAP2G162_9BACT|nr:DUF177 domain-containing protein [Litoribacter alkaliphilus]MBS9524089.1 DUF177 domain-containing protein [Litoribacter alkaliphilus]